MKRFAALLLALSLPAQAADLTIYNSDLGLVRETRKIRFETGASTVRAAGVPSRLDPSSVRLAADGVTVLEQGFENDLADPNRLLERHVGREVEFERIIDGKRDTVKGTLLAIEGGRVLRSGGKIILDPQGSPILPDLPEGTAVEPTLFWRVTSKSTGEKDAQISYLTGGLSWMADYVLELSPKDDRVDLGAWATVTNDTGSDFNDARVKLVAGDVNRVAPAGAPVEMRRMMKTMAFAADAGNAAPVEQFSEYHLYEIPRPVSLKRRQTRQIALAQATNVPAKKSYVFDPQGHGGVMPMNAYTRSDPNYGLGADDAVYTILEFTNSADGGLGGPLPRGRVRVYKADGKGSLQLAGEDSLRHTAKNEKIRVKLGRVFDMTGERKRISVVSDKRSMEETFEITVTNRKEEAATVVATERLSRWSAWKITASSKPFRKKDAQTVEFDLPVVADGSTTVSYTVRYTW